MRRQWFEAFKLKSTLNAKEMWTFHHIAGVGDSNVDVVLDRAFVKTTSVTQVEKQGDEVRMVFEDLASRVITEKRFEATNV